MRIDTLEMTEMMLLVFSCLDPEKRISLEGLEREISYKSNGHVTPSRDLLERLLRELRSRSLVHAIRSEVVYYTISTIGEHQHKTLWRRLHRILELSRPESS